MPAAFMVLMKALLVVEDTIRLTPKSFYIAHAARLRRSCTTWEGVHRLSIRQWGWDIAHDSVVGLSSFFVGVLQSQGPVHYQRMRTKS